MAKALVGGSSSLRIVAMLARVPARLQPGGFGSFWSVSARNGEQRRTTGGLFAVGSLEIVKFCTAKSPTVAGGPPDEIVTWNLSEPAGTAMVSSRCVNRELFGVPFQPALCP